MRGYTNASGGSGSLEGITFDRESFIQYFESLGSINDVRDRMENFLSSVAYSFQSGTISADKIRTTGSNLMPRLDSFEDEIGRVIPSSPEESGLNNLVINFLQTHPLYPQPPHGDGVLQLTTEIGSGPFSIFLNPYRAEDSTWITVPKMNYWFSYYLYTSAPTNITGVIELVDALGSPVISVPFQITESNGWTRFSDDFELLSNNELSLKITIDQGGVTVYLDAIQLEHKTILNPSAPNDFSPGGKVIIEGGNIRAGSIFATDSIFADAAIVSANIDSLAANKIAAGRINTDIIQIGGEDNLMLMNDNKITFFQPVNGGEYAKVEIGKLTDAVLPEDQIWGLIVRNQDGSAALFDSNGITTDGINEGLRLAKIIDYNDIDDIYNIKGQYVSVDGSTLVSDTVVASKLYAGDVEANKIQGTNIAGDVITAEHLNAVITTGKRIMLGESVVTAGIDGAGVAASTVRLWAGADYDNKATAPFRVTQEGSLYASAATITGSIKATSGYIGGSTSGWVINSGSIQSSGGTTKLTLDGLNAKVYSGAGTFGNANTPFYFDGTNKFSLGDKLSFDGSNLVVKGDITGSSGTFSGLVSGGSININNVFTVSNTGAMNATGASISGTISGSTITGSTISGGSINIGNYFRVSSGGFSEITTSDGGFFVMGGTSIVHPWASALNVSWGESRGISFRNSVAQGSAGSEVASIVAYTDSRLRLQDSSTGGSDKKIITEANFIYDSGTATLNITNT